MNKILAIVVFGLTVLLICCWVTIDRFRTNDTLDEICYTVAQTYNLYNDEVMIVPVYDSQSQALISYAENAEAYLVDKTGDTCCKVMINKVNMVDTLIYRDDVLYKFNLEINLKVSELVIHNCYLELYYPKQKISLFLGDIYCMSKQGKPLFGLRNLYGLAFEEPFHSLGAICLSFENTTNQIKTLTNIKLPSNHQAYLIDVVNLDINANLIKDVFDYDYQIAGKMKPVSIAPKNKVTLLIGIKYIDDLALMNTPITLIINNETYYLDNFIYLSSNDLAKSSHLLYRGSIYDFQSR